MEIYEIAGFISGNWFDCGALGWGLGIGVLDCFFFFLLFFLLLLSRIFIYLCDSILPFRSFAFGDK